MANKSKAAKSVETTETNKLVANLVNALANSISKCSKKDKLPSIFINDKCFHVYDFGEKQYGWELPEVESCISSEMSEDLLVMRSRDDYKASVVLVTDEMDWALKLLQNPFAIEAYIRSHETDQYHYYILDRAKDLAMKLIENQVNYLTEAYGLDSAPCKN